MRQVGWCGLVLMALLGGSERPVWSQELGAADPGRGGLPAKSVSGPRPAPAADRPAGFRLAPGDDATDPLPIADLPFADIGETCGFQDDYDAACSWSSNAPDVVYAFTPPQDMQLDIDLCGSGYDTKAFLLDAGLNVLACSDDYYGPGDPCGSYVSRLAGARVSGGQTVYLVIDGYAGGCGSYQLGITEYVPCFLDCRTGLSEDEPTLRDNYDDQFNGGCNSPRVVPPVMTLQADLQGELTFCGVSGFYGGSVARRDTDWFAITLGPTGEAVWQLNAEQTTLGLVLDLACPNPTQYGVVVGGPCATGSLTIVGRPGEAIGLWVGPPGYTPPLNMSGNEYNYEFTLSGLSPHQAVSVTTLSWGAVKGLYR